MTMRTPFRQINGSGSAKSGTHHFWHQRLTAIILLPLTVLFIALIVVLAGQDYDTTLNVLAKPYISIPVFLFIVAGVYHMQIGMQVIIEDYAHGGTKVICIILNNLFSLAVGLASAFAVLKISFGM
jgi:succinate dehydrogenase / fumarate reductase, membrane anchor subunit